MEQAIIEGDLIISKIINKYSKNICFLLLAHPALHRKVAVYD